MKSRIFIGVGIGEVPAGVWTCVSCNVPGSSFSGDRFKPEAEIQTNSQHGIGSTNDLHKRESQKTAPGMKIYRNEKHGFEIDLPDCWTPPPAEAYEFMNFIEPLPPGSQKDFFQYGCAEEAFNFEIAPLFTEPLLADTEVEFKLFARDRGFTGLDFGRITVEAKEHVCASYFVNDTMGPRWNKKYMIVLGGVEYAVTGTCIGCLMRRMWFSYPGHSWLFFSTGHFSLSADHLLRSIRAFYAYPLAL